MKERLIQLLDLEQLTPSKFADIIGVQRSSVSHVISGRNNPSFDFIQKTLRAFPGLNAEWLILGEGTMYEQMGRGISGNLFEPSPEPETEAFPEHMPAPDRETEPSADSQGLEEVRMEDQSDSDSSQDQDHTSETSILQDKIDGNVVQVMVFYADNTFRTYTPAK